MNCTCQINALINRSTALVISRLPSVGKMLCVLLKIERTEKVSLSSIKTVVSEPIESHPEYHLMVGLYCALFSALLGWLWLSSNGIKG